LNVSLTPRTFRKTASLVLGSALLLGVAACGTGKTQDVVLDGKSHSDSIAQWRTDVDNCMLDAGFDIRSTANGGPSDSIDTSKFDMDAFNRNYTSCIKKIGEAPVDESLPSDDEMFAVQLVFAKCMRDSGYDFPDPVKGGMSQAFGPDTDPKVVDACSTKAKDAEPKK